ncbi:MAG: cation transporter [Nanoarchaeota archaeon]|nr:cation transporter [Nanoarchaeota archaeon]MBU1135352.1 cation transporter [Nanoarchaeota archaeon]MBU2519716.1 cation transporter [Nanoarchaeota archaeon]
MKSAEILVKGMTCKSCEMLIEEALLDMGVKVDSFTKEGDITVTSITFDDKIDIKEIIEAIKNEGFEVDDRK